MKSNVILEQLLAVGGQRRTTTMFKLLIGLSLLGSILAGHYDGFKVFKVTPSNEDQIKFVKSWQDQDGIDFWNSVHNKVGLSARVMVSPERIQDFTDAMLKNNIPHELIIANVDEYVFSLSNNIFEQ